MLRTRGPYAFSRHPMYLGKLSLWFGWVILYGSPVVLAGFALVCLGVSRLVPREERAVEARFADQYREYRIRAPRWLGVRS